MKKISKENRLDNYNYMKNLTDWVPKEEIFNKDFVWPRQMEIHLPSNKEIACDFHCFYCQGSKLDMSLGMDERKALKFVQLKQNFLLMITNNIIQAF